jgi:cytochrome c-type biogenesis protein CcmF
LVIVQEKKNMLKVWNVSLVALTSLLCIVGTFLTRSGFTSCIHAYTISRVGWWFIGYIAIVATVSIVVIARNLDQLRSPHRIDSLVSREATFLFHNLLVVALAFAILWGVLFPSISEALSGHRVATQSPLLRLLRRRARPPAVAAGGHGARRGLAPCLAARRRAGLPLAVRLGARGRGAARPAGYASSVAGIVALSLCLFVAVTIGLELARGTAARRALTPGISWPAALAQLVGRNRRRYGGYVVHLAVMIGVVAIVGTSAYATSRTLVLAPGQRVQFHGCGLQLRSIESPITRSYISTEAVVDVYRAAIGSTRCAPRRGPTSTPASRPSRSRSARCCAPGRISTSSWTARRGPAWSRSMHS